MKKSITAILLFVIIVFVLDRLLYTVLDHFYSKTFVGQDGGDINKYLQDSNPPELVIMGSSTARFQVNPDSFPVKSCNLAHSMTTDRFQLGLLLLMIKNKKIPKHILLSLWPRDYLVFGKHDQRIEDVLYLKYYYNQSDFIKKEINSLSYFEPLKFAFSSYRFNGNVTNTMKYYYLNRSQDAAKYYFKYQASNTNDSINLVNAQRIHDASYVRGKTLELSALQTGYLQQFIDTCAKYKINLMCFYMPMYDEDTLLIKNGVDYMDKVIAMKKVPLFRFTKANAGVLFTSPGFWVDGEHMNEKGGAIESKMLAAYVKEHLVKN